MYSLREAEKELEKIDLEVGRGLPSKDIIDDDDDDDDVVDDAAGDIAVGLNDNALEANRAHQCADHGSLVFGKLSLAIQYCRSQHSSPQKSQTIVHLLSRSNVDLNLIANYLAQLDGVKDLIRKVDVVVGKRRQIEKQMFHNQHVASNSA